MSARTRPRAGAAPRGLLNRWFSTARRETLDYRIRQRIFSPIACTVRPTSGTPEFTVAWGNMLATGIQSRTPAVDLDMALTPGPGRPA